MRVTSRRQDTLPHHCPPRLAPGLLITDWLSERGCSDPIIGCGNTVFHHPKRSVLPCWWAGAIEVTSRELALAQLPRTVFCQQPGLIRGLADPENSLWGGSLFWAGKIISATNHTFSAQTLWPTYRRHSGLLALHTPSLSLPPLRVSGHVSFSLFSQQQRRPWSFRGFWFVPPETLEAYNDLRSF